MLAMDPVQPLLFGIFAGLTALLDAALGPTYDHLLVPMLSEDALYPGVPGGGFLGSATALSGRIVLGLVDPAIPLIALVLGLLYLGRAVVPTLAARTQALVPKLVVGVLLANFSGPIAGAILGLAGAGYPVIAGADGGAWQQWTALAGPGLLAYSWDNGVLAFVLALVLFSLVLLLSAAVAVRDALLAVLLVLLPLFSLVYPVPGIGQLAQRGWTWFGQLAFLPWVVVVPLELAVGAPSAPLLVGYLVVALAAPGLLSIAGTSLAGLGLPSGGSALSYGLQRNLSLASAAAGSYAAPGLGRSAPSATNAVRGAARTATGVPLPVSLPFFAGEMAGHALVRAYRHLPGRGPAPPRFPPVHGRPARGPPR